MKILANRRPILAAEDSDSQVDDMISQLKDDFDFILSGLERLERQGANGKNDALIIGEDLSSSLQGHIDQLASKLGGNE